jgi:hypothetical protein
MKEDTNLISCPKENSEIRELFSKCLYDPKTNALQIIRYGARSIIRGTLLAPVTNATSFVIKVVLRFLILISG